MTIWVGIIKVPLVSSISCYLMSFFQVLTQIVIFFRSFFPMILPLIQLPICVKTCFWRWKSRKSKKLRPLLLFQLSKVATGDHFRDSKVKIWLKYPGLFLMAFFAAGPFDDYPGFQPMKSWANTYAEDCKMYWCWIESVTILYVTSLVPLVKCNKIENNWWTWAPQLDMILSKHTNVLSTLAKAFYMEYKMFPPLVLPLFSHENRKLLHIVFAFKLRFPN